MRTFPFVLAAAALLLAACDGAGSGTHTPSPPVSSTPVITPTQTASPAVSATPPEVPAKPRPTQGPVSLSCTAGWHTPGKGSSRYAEPLRVIRRTTGVGGPLVVVDMRYFEGPESPPSEMGYLALIQRWFVKLYAKDDPSFQGRFIVEARRFGSGVAAVAAYDSRGFRSPDWIGFQYDSAHRKREAYPGLPGGWSGIPYDFVKGGEGLKIPGLPDAVVGCLRGT